MIVPILSGSGMRMKILEAAAMSLPIVTTTVGVEGIDLVDGESCLIADTPDAFANAILRLEHDTALCRGLGEQANRVFRAKYHPSVLAKARNEIYSTIIQSKP
jgi:glycosyltransferase involved in cell wall biosynthesis